MVLIKTGIQLKELHTFHLDATCKQYCCVSSEDELISVLNADNIFVLGNGSNTVFCHDFDGLIIHMKIDDIRIVSETNSQIMIRVGAGTSWDYFVNWCLEHGYYGLENLIMIPGTIGGAVVQNIGAYGMEVANAVENVHAINKTTLKKYVLTNDCCHFTYRGSVFKKSDLVVTYVTFHLSKAECPCLDYASVQQALQEMPSDKVTTLDVVNVIKDMRKRKLPDTSVIGNAGSFFKNIIIDINTYNNLLTKYPDIKSWFIDNNHVKVSTAWLMSKCDLGGLSRYGIKLCDSSPLILTNYKATGQDLLRAIKYICDTARSKFGLMLEPEVIVV